MRVLHVIPSVAARDGGPAVVALAAARSLNAAGHETLVVTTDADGPDRLDVAVGAKTTWQDVPVIFFPRAATEAFKWSPRLAAWLRRHVGEFDVVDVHAVFSHSSIAAARACRTARVPYVVRPHGALDPWSLGRRAVRKRLVLAAGARRMLQAAARMQYTTPTEQQLAERVLPWLPAGVVVPLGVDDACFVSRTTGSEAPYVLALSRIEQKKGIELLIDAFHQIVAAGETPAWRLVIAGDGEAGYVAALKARAAGGAAAGRIAFPGWVTGDAKRALVAGATAFVSPSTQENFGLSVMEAMAAGVPVLVSPGVNLAGEIEAANAGWVVERDEAALAARLRSILADPSDRAARGRGARQLAEQYRWSRSTSALVDLYRAVVAEREVAVRV